MIRLWRGYRWPELTEGSQESPSEEVICKRRPEELSWIKEGDSTQVEAPWWSQVPRGEGQCGWSTMQGKLWLEGRLDSWAGL